ncbi:MAG TPA: hypothetical protein VN228_06645 [Pyrinomonadaceae bacterium]|nr:hypothetical protein [Pyrinomonadaceae bacterium]
MATKKTSSKRARATSSGLSAGNTQTTALTPNSNCTAVGSGDSNDTTAIAFMSPQNGFAYWSPSVAITAPKAVNATDKGNAIVTFTKGLTVTLQQSSGGVYSVFVSGDIIDNGTLYSFINQIIYMSSGASVGEVRISKL